MKTITIKQPWAWLIFNEGKDIENRTWRTKHRGITAIHTSAKVDIKIYNELISEGIYLPPINKLICGHIIGTVNIVDCVKESLSPWKEKDSWGFILGNIKAFEIPILCKGRLGFWNWELNPNNNTLKK